MISQSKAMTSIPLKAQHDLMDPQSVTKRWRAVSLVTHPVFLPVKLFYMEFNQNQSLYLVGIL